MSDGLENDNEVAALLSYVTGDKCESTDAERYRHVDALLVLIASAGSVGIMQRAVDVYGSALDEIANPEYGCGFNALRKRAKKALRDVPPYIRSIA